VTRTNTQIMSGEINATQMLQTRFEQEVASTVTFEFNSARLTPEAMRVLSQQADWIRQFPELRFSVFGHTDLVGSNGYNYALGKRRAQAVVNYFASQGISRSRLEALVSYGKTRPVVATTAPEQANRRTVTTVSGFVRRSSAPLNGKYAEVVFREYVQGATRPHPQTSTTASQVNPADN
jgi:outer membrane protein OmpA-like peptidoglycan-associated protein